MKGRNDKLYVFDINQCCEKIESYLQNVTKDDFLKNEMLQDAIVRNIEIIGEASKSLSSELKEENPNIPWRDIMRMRDKIVHHYFRLILDVVWQTATEDIPVMKTEIKKILDAFPEEK